jgi:hypothetical protein
VDIQLDPISAQLGRERERRHRVFGAVRARSAMANDDRPSAAQQAHCGHRAAA